MRFNLLAIGLFCCCVCLSIQSSFSNKKNDYSEGDGCFPFVLKNECASVLLGNVSIKETKQQDYFDEFVSLNVSDVRMFKTSCRRPFLNYFCQLAFGLFFCASSSPEQALCLEEQSCLQVADACSDDFLLDCSSSPLSSTPSPSDCSEEVSNQMNEALETAIAVQTCLDGSKEEIECCLDPYVFDDNDECVVECPQYTSSKTLGSWIRNTTFVFYCLSLAVLIASMIPFFGKNTLRYPNNILFLFYGAFLLGFTPSLWVIFFGGPKSFLCNGEKNYLKALDHYGNSTRSILQEASRFLFTSWSVSLWTLFCFNLFCLSTRPFTSSFEKFILPPVNQKILLSIFVTCVLISVVPFSIFLIYSFLNRNSRLFIPNPVSFDPVPIEHFLVVIQYPFIIVGASGFLFLFIAIALFLKRGREIIYFQWRAFLAASYWVPFSMMIGIELCFFPPSATDLMNNLNCVASHPRISPTLCSQENQYPFFQIFDLFFVALFFVLCVITLWTNDLVVNWWKELLFTPRSSIEYEKIDTL